ncbi:MAG TPA: hypothetical protein VLM87_15925 [Rubrivivax sp.]|nr:hypothetical protein [Rubrivivax sp.]
MARDKRLARRGHGQRPWRALAHGQSWAEHGIVQRAAWPPPDIQPVFSEVKLLP